MPIKELQITGFRNLQSINIHTGDRFNLFYGKNGSGKTSLLESIYYLGMGRSFRTHLSQHLIQHTQNCFSIFAFLEETGQKIPIGIEKDKSGFKRIKINGEVIQQLSALVQMLPLQLISTESYRFFYDGPKRRRQYLDWGVFHVEHSFLSNWQRMQHLLKQRNAAVKMQRPSHEVSIWDPEFLELSELINKSRRNYILNLQPVLNSMLESFMRIPTLELHYYPGWSENRGLESLLREELHRDFKLGYTHHGPQRADIQLLHNGKPAQEYLSQGQLKVASYALHLAQGVLMNNMTGRSPIYLIDDLPSELDSECRSCIIQILAKLSSQVFVTGIEQSDLKEFLNFDKAQMFHVEHGNVVIV